MKPRRLIDSDVTPDGERVELLFEAGHYVVRVDGASLMSSAMYGSEQAMAALAAQLVGGRSGCRVLVGGLGLGFTLRAVLDDFADDARVTVAELLPPIVRFHRGELAELAGRALDDPRVVLHEGDVARCLDEPPWDAILLDTDNGPEAFTVAGNERLYSRAGIARLASALAPGGALIVWSAFPSPAFERALARGGLDAESRRVRARASGKGPKHTLFLGRKPAR